MGTRVRDGVIPNQYGTWPLGRAGWCPGMPVEWWEFDVTDLLLRENSNSIAYRALFNGTDYHPLTDPHGNSNGYPAELHLASFITFYASNLNGSARRLGTRAPSVSSLLV